MLFEISEHVSGHKGVEQSFQRFKEMREISRAWGI